MKWLVGVSLLLLAWASPARASDDPCGLTRPHYDWLVSDLEEGRETHLAWARYLEVVAPEGGDFQLAVGTAQNQWWHVRHYDERLGAVRALGSLCGWR